MFELCQVGSRSYYLNCPAKIGIYRAAENDVYLIDSGGDRDAGKKIRKILDEQGWQLRGILLTHSNADHIGGCQYLQKQIGCKIFSSGIEAAFTRHPILEPSFLYGGFPCKDLRHKFLLAAESAVCDFQDEAFPEEIKILPLPGHFFDMVGFRTPDDVLYLADCLSSEDTLEKYQIGFIYDVAAYLETLEHVKAMQAAMFVPAHAAATPDISALAQINMDKVQEIAAQIRVFCETPLCFEDLLQKLFTAYSLTMNFEQYVLVGSTVRSYLSWMKDTEQLTAFFSENRLLWHRQ